jgi:hypothetical protein
MILQRWYGDSPRSPLFLSTSPKPPCDFLSGLASPTGVSIRVWFRYVSGCMWRWWEFNRLHYCRNFGVSSDWLCTLLPLLSLFWVSSDWNSLCFRCCRFFRFFFEGTQQADSGMKLLAESTVWLHF